MIRHLLIIAPLFVAVSVFGQSQCVLDPGSGEFVTPSGAPCPNAIPTAVPFLRIIPDARAGAMGDVGLATSPDANSMAQNTAKLAFVDNKMSISATYSPWLAALDLQDIYLAYLAGYRQIDDNQSVGLSLRFFSLGDVPFTLDNGQPAGTGTPNELEFAIGYARKLGENFSVGINGKFIYSNLAAGRQVQGIDINAGVAGAADISFYYRIPTEGGSLDLGLALSNLGSKISYTNEVNDFLPANFGLGATYNAEFNEFNKLAFSLDFNRLMVPSPQFGDVDTDPANGIPDYREKPFFSGVLGSFGDAPGGFEEELREFTISTGLEYWYYDQFALRAGYFYESPLKGNRRFFTLGVGLKYNVFEIDLSYLVSINNTAQQTNPLDKTLRFSLKFNFDETAGGSATGGN